MVYCLNLYKKSLVIGRNATPAPNWKTVSNNCTKVMKMTADFVCRQLFHFAISGWTPTISTVLLNVVCFISLSRLLSTIQVFVLRYCCSEPKARIKRFRGLAYLSVNAPFPFGCTPLFRLPGRPAWLFLVPREPLYSPVP